MKAPSQFKRDFRKLLDRAGDKADAVVRSTAQQMIDSMIINSPVGDPKIWQSPAPAGYSGGTFRANWHIGLGSIDTDTSQQPDESGERTIDRARAKLSQWQAGQSIFLTNSLPYALRLEYGWSSQAPVGMVRTTVTEYEQYLRRAVASLT